MTKRFSSIAGFIVTLGICSIWATTAVALPEGRVYERVSPEYKGGYGISAIVAVAPNGESVVFLSLGAFAGDATNDAVTNDYVARRGTSGWSTAPLQAPASPYAYNVPEDFSPTLSSSLAVARLGPSLGVANYESDESAFLLHSLVGEGGFEVAGMDLLAPDHKQASPFYLSSSPDFSHILFYDPNESAPLLRLAEGTASRLYDLTTQASGGAPGLKLVGLTNSGRILEPSCQDSLGSEAAARNTSLNAVADGGREIFFSDGIGSSGSCRKLQLFVRVSGAHTVEVSRPLTPGCREVPCAGAGERAPAEFQGASEDGSLVYFTTAQALTGEDGDAGNDLYVASIGCPGGVGECEREPNAEGVLSLKQASHGQEAAAVQGVVAIAPDGSRAYFVARGVLSAVANGAGASAVKGADNLYVYDEAEGSVSFVGELCSGPELSGLDEDVHCPAANSPNEAETRNYDTGLWAGQPEAQTVRDGRYLVFSTYAQLTGDDTDTARDVYRYDAQTGGLERVSVGSAGYHADGNDDSFDASITARSVATGLYDQHDLGDRAVSESGGRIVFKTAEPLSPEAVNGLTDLYEWSDEGASGEPTVSLVSPGRATASVSQGVISDTGRDIFFVTAERLAPQDGDEFPDLYDARIGGGFPAPSAPSRPCEGDACQGPLTAPVPLLIPGTASQAAEAPLAPPPPPAAKAKKTKAPKRKAKHRRKPAGRGHKRAVKQIKRGSAR